MGIEIDTGHTLPAGLRRRPYRDALDHAAMTALINATNIAYGIKEVDSIEQTAHQFERRTDCDPAVDFAFIEDDSAELTAFGGLNWRDDDEGQRIYYSHVYVAPEWSQQTDHGVEAYLFGFCEQRARELAAQDRPSRPVHSSSLPDAATGLLRLHEAAGYTRVRRSMLMRRPLTAWPAAPLPPGIELRPAQPAQLRTIWDAREAAFADHWGHGQRSEEDYITWVSEPTHDLSLWQVAWDTSTGQVVGSSINTIYELDNERFGFKRGEVSTLGVVRAWRGRGLAKALLAASFSALAERGMTEAILGVDASNPTGAVQLYERMGFVSYWGASVWRKPVQLNESGPGRNK